MKPWMSKRDIKSIKHLILETEKDYLSILEWGVGGSTKYFTKFMSKHNINYDWLSLEYNKNWYNKIKALNIRNVSIVLFSVSNNKIKQRHTNMDDYVNYPLTLNKTFDLILVDGRKRRRCLINASKLLNNNGIVLLHDANRKYYHCAFGNFHECTFISPLLWIGRMRRIKVKIKKC